MALPTSGFVMLGLPSTVRDDMHRLIDHALDHLLMPHFADLFPAFDSQSVQRILHRVAARMPIVFRIADVLTDDRSGLPMLRWSGASSGLKYYLSDAEYNLLFQSESDKMLGYISSFKVAGLVQTAEQNMSRQEGNSSHVTAGQVSRHIDGDTSDQPEMEPLKFSTADGHGSSSSIDPLDAELSRRLALPYLLISEASHLLSDIQQRQRKWVVISEEIIDSHQTLILALTRYLLTEEGVKISGKRDRDRAEFLARARLQPPPVLRVIDIQATCQTRTVVLTDCRHDEVQTVGFSAISHTYGMEVYDIFNCQCTTKVSSVYMNPRCLVGPCPHDSTVSVESSRTRDRVVNDILGMCENLCKAGVEYAWHDGVCICQHDDEEVKEMIKCMGWVYAYAKETIIFLHYVGKPMAPIGPGDGVNELICRWHTRVWTLQEGALSNRRRYCVRVGNTANFKRLQHCQSLEEYEKEVGLWYKEELSKVEVIDEKSFVIFLWQIYTALADPLLANYAKTRSCMDLDIQDGLEMWSKGDRWVACLYKFISNILVTCFNFPSPELAIRLGGSRDSKHVGDHINSILALTGVKDFVAPKDEHMELSTIQFFERQEQPAGLARALFSVNACLLEEDVERYMREVRKHTWPPLLWKSLSIHQKAEDFASAPIHFRVQEDGNLELTAKLLCVAVRFMDEQRRLVINRAQELDRFFDANVFKEYCIDIDRPYLKMYTAPLPHLSRFQATAPENACCNVGIADVFMYYDNSSTTGSGRGSSSTGCSTQNNSNTDHFKRMDEMGDGDSFDAYFVVPMHHFRLVQEAHKGLTFRVGTERSCEWCKALPMLLIQGNALDAPVSKIGCFVPACALTRALEDMLAKYEEGGFAFPAFSFLDKIVFI